MIDRGSASTARFLAKLIQACLSKVMLSSKAATNIPTSDRILLLLLGPLLLEASSIPCAHDFLIRNVDKVGSPAKLAHRSPLNGTQGSSPITSHDTISCELVSERFVEFDKAMSTTHVGNCVLADLLRFWDELHGKAQNGLGDLLFAI